MVSWPEGVIFLCDYVHDDACIVPELLFVLLKKKFYLGLLTFNVTSNNITVILWCSILFVEEIGVPRENCRLKVFSNFVTWSCIAYTLIWRGNKISGIDCTGKYKWSWNIRSQLLWIPCILWIINIYRPFQYFVSYIMTNSHVRLVSYIMNNILIWSYRWNHWLLIGVWKRLQFRWMLGIGSLSVMLHLEPKVGNLNDHAPCISEFWVLDLFCCWL